ncbi:MAG: OB-fold domain-containing protein [Pseudomonadota bacterium]
MSEKRSEKRSETSTTGPLPVVPYLKIPSDGEPYLEGHKCGACGATFLGERNHCSKCGARDQMTVVALPKTGKLYSYSIVHRSFPGIDVPYVSAVVDLDDGTAVKSNLINVEPDPEHISFDMRVELVFGDALGRKDRDGNSYMAFFFQPKS